MLLIAHQLKISYFTLSSIVYIPFVKDDLLFIYFFELSADQNIATIFLMEQSSRHIVTGEDYITFGTANQIFAENTNRKSFLSFRRFSRLGGRFHTNYLVFLIVDDFTFHRFVFVLLLVFFFVAWRFALGRLVLLVHLGANRHDFVAQLFSGGFNFVLIVVFAGFFSSFNGLVDGFFVVIAELVFIVGLHFFGLVNSIIKYVAGIDRFTLFLVFFGVSFSFFAGFFDLFFIKVAAVLNRDALFFATGFIF